MDVKKQLGEKIKRLRKSRRLTQEQMAELIDIAPRNLINIELGVNFPKAETLEKILVALDVSLQKLFETDHLVDDKDLIAEIYRIIDDSKNDRATLEMMYKLLKCVTNRD